MSVICSLTIILTNNEKLKNDHLYCLINKIEYQIFIKNHFYFLYMNINLFLISN